MFKGTRKVTLYIVGNGFDLYHGLDTRYQSFASYLERANLEIYDLALKYYGLPHDGIPEILKQFHPGEWARFEEALANLDYVEVLEDNSDYAGNLGSANFRDSDWHSYEIQMQIIIEKLTKNLKEIFSQFILNIRYPEDNTGVALNLKARSIYLNFNFTDTLERYYSIPKSSICYIHNKASDSRSQIILGHGIDPTTFESKEMQESSPPAGLTDEELNRWKDHMSDQYDYMYESAKNRILTYYSKSFKNTATIIDEKRSFFKKLSGVDEIYILGHSMSDVDLPYFKKVIQRVKSSTIYHVSYHDDKDEDKFRSRLQDLGVSKYKINLIRISDLKIKY